MVSIFVGSGAGFARGSGATLGSAGILGSAVQGRSGESVSVNAATGNLLISQQDEFIAGRGPDVGISRTYNSLAEMSDGDNGDQWQFSTTRRVFGLTGTLNTAGSTIRRQGGDGSVATYGWDAGQSAYMATDGDGAHDRLVKSGSTWIWTDGSSRVTETYEVSEGDPAVYRLKALADTDGNQVDYNYLTGIDKIQTITTANHNNVNPATGISEVSYVYYSWSGDNLGMIVTGYTDYGNLSTEADNVNRQLTRTRYAYDGQNRLTQVTVDLSPEDNSVGDGRTYVTAYTYDGSSKRVASITQTDGSSLAIAYDAAGRVTTLTQSVAAGDVRVTSLTYGPSFTDVTAPDGQVTRLEYTGGNIGSSAVQDWIAGGLSWDAAGSIGGEPAVKFTSAPGATWSAISWGTQAQAGDVFKLNASLMAVPGSSTSQTVGLYGNNSYWGTGGSSARILSGPGQLVHGGGGNWKIIGLSTTEATRVEVTRTYSQAEYIGAYLYVDDLDGFRDGQQLIMAGVTLTKGDGDTVAPKQLSRIIAPSASTGAPRQTMEFVYSPNGDLIETRTGTLGENLLDLDGWAGAQRGPNLLDLSGWPVNPDNLPSGPATLAGWANPWPVNESRWAKAIGPQGGPVAVIQTGQTDSLENGGGNYSHGFAIDKNKAYEFTTYFQVTDLDKHRLYFGIDGNNSVLNAADGTPDNNPYFAYPLPTTGSNYKAGRWYKIVGYVLPAGAGNVQDASDLGGIYDVETGERIDNVRNFRWADTQPSGSPQGGVRFFNYYNESIQGYYTNYYRPEVHEIIGNVVGRALDGKLNSGFAENLLANTAGGIANAATRSAVSGNSFGDNLRAALPDIIGQTIGNLVANGIAGGGDTKRPARNQFAQADTGVRSDAPTPIEQYFDEIVVTARKKGDEVAKKGRGFLDWIDRTLDTNLGGNNPHTRSKKSDRITVTFGQSNFFRPSTAFEIARATRGMSPDAPFNASQPSTVRSWVLQRRFADNVSGLVSGTLGSDSWFGQNIGSPVGSLLDLTLRNTIGPGTPLDTLVNKPFYAVVDGIAATPLGDPGVIMSIESGGPTGSGLVRTGWIYRPGSNTPELTTLFPK